MRTGEHEVLMRTYLPKLARVGLSLSRSPHDWAPLHLRVRECDHLMGSYQRRWGQQSPVTYLGAIDRVRGRRVVPLE